MFSHEYYNFVFKHCNRAEYTQLKNVSIQLNYAHLNSTILLIAMTSGIVKAICEID